MKTHPLYLNGEFIFTDKNIAVNNPATGQAFANMCVADRAYVAQAVEDAHAAFAGWRALTAKARGEFLRKIADELEKRRDEIAHIITTRTGKPFAQSQGGYAPFGGVRMSGWGRELDSEGWDAFLGTKHVSIAI